MAIRGVLIDYSGTLFRLQINTEQLAGLGHHEGRPDADRNAELMRVLTAPITPSTHLPAELRADWERRDLDPEIHRTVYLAALRGAGLVSAGLAEAYYELLLRPESWQLYPDGRAALERLRAAGIPVAVVSNIAFDVRPMFDRFGVTDLVDEFVLSYVEGSMKPDAKIFRVAVERLDVDPGEVLMIGDSPEADGGAAALGSAVEIVEPLPTDQRPDALLTALAAHGL